MAKDNYIPKIISVRQMEAYLRFASGFTGSGAVKEPKRRDIGVMTEENHGLEQAKAQFDSIKEMVEAEWVAAANEAGWKEFTDEFNVMCWRYTDGATWAGTARQLCEEHSIELTEEQREDAERAIREDPLSVLVRSDWYEPGAALTMSPDPAEYEILLCTGGPAVRIRGDLDRGTPTSARLEHQDWFKPWTQYHCDQDVLLAYASHFWFGE